MAMQEEELELSLGLSIGGRFGSYQRSKPIRENLVEYSEIAGDCKETYRILGGSSFSPAGDAGETGGVCRTPKKDIHALRRQEARKKREEKQHKKGASRGKNGGYLNGSVPIRSDSMDDQWFVAQVQTRVRDREAKEIEANQSERNCKKNRTENGGSGGNSCVLEDEQRNEMFSGKQNQTLNQIHGENPSVMASSPVPLVPMQYSFAPLKCVPFGNGFAYPYVMPCWAPSAAALSDDKNVFQPVPCPAFVPFQAPHWNSKDNVLTTCDSEQDGCKQSQSLLASTTSGSRGSSSSVLSDQHSGSRQASGGSSSDTRSHSSCSPSEQPQMHISVVNDSHGQSDHSSSSQLVEPSNDVEDTTMTADKVVPSSITQQTQRKTEEGPLSITKPSSITKPILNTNSPSTQPLKEVKKERSKPPKPQTPHLQTPPLPHMPCVSTTGTGPNGKTITGFLYRYTKSEVSIICVCHGTSFSPAEFVKHAGGTDISHPLRHIIMAPSSCG